MIQMASMMRGAGFDPLAGAPGGPTQPTFPAPGDPNASQLSNAGQTSAVPGSTPPPGGGTTPAPARNLFGPNPFGADPSALLQLLGAGGGFGSGTTSLGSSPPPTDVRPPEERFQVQLQVRTLPCAPHSPWNNTDSRLQQLQDMGFTNASQNVRALLATGGNVHSAIEYILNGGGL
jgi:ubiquilin